MRHVRYVEQPEGNREPDADRRVETSEEEPGKDRLEEKLNVQADRDRENLGFP